MLQDLSSLLRILLGILRSIGNRHFLEEPLPPPPPWLNPEAPLSLCCLCIILGAQLSSTRFRPYVYPPSLSYRIVCLPPLHPSTPVYRLVTSLYSSSRSLYSWYRPLIGKSHARACLRRHATQGRCSHVVGCAVQTYRVGEASEHATARGIVARLLATISGSPDIQCL